MGPWFSFWGAATYGVEEIHLFLVRLSPALHPAAKGAFIAFVNERRRRREIKHGTR